MNKSYLEQNVLQAAISVRMKMNTDLPYHIEEAYYSLLKSAAEVSRVIGSKDFLFIGKMLETYEQDRKKKEDARQMTIYDAWEGGDWL